MLVYLQQGAEHYRLAASILARLPGVPVVVVEDGPALTRRLLDEGTPLEGQKRRIFLALRQGSFIKPFPRGRAREADPVDFLLVERGCPFDCHYCYLQGYLDHAVPTVFVNRERLGQDLRALEARPGPARLLAGELGETLAIDALTKTASTLVEAALAHPAITFEVRTKSDRIDGIVDAPAPVARDRYRPPPNLVLAWTLSPVSIADRFESGAAPVEARLAAAARAQRKGWRIGLRLDPIFRSPHWERGYRALLSRVVDHLEPDKIESWHLGGFRYGRALEAVARERFPGSPLFLGESFPGEDGKIRYFKPLRVEMYRRIIASIRELDSGAKVRLIMETAAVRRAVLEPDTV